MKFLSSYSSSSPFHLVPSFSLLCGTSQQILFCLVSTALPFTSLNPSYWFFFPSFSSISHFEASLYYLFFIVVFSSYLLRLLFIMFITFPLLCVSFCFLSHFLFLPFNLLFFFSISGRRYRNSVFLLFSSLFLSFPLAIFDLSIIIILFFYFYFIFIFLYNPYIPRSFSQCFHICYFSASFLHVIFSYLVSLKIFVSYSF